MAQRVPAGKIVADECLIHEDQRGATRDLVLIPGAPPEQRNLQRGEVFGADEFYVSLLGLRGRLSQYFDRKDPATIRRSGIGRDSGSDDTGYFGDFLTNLRE